MNKDELINRLRLIFEDVVLSVEDSEYDDPEYRTGKRIDFVNYRCPSDESMLHLAALRGELEGAKLLVELGITIDLVGDMGNTALHYAACRGHFDVYDYLLEQGADRGIVNEFSKTPADYRKQEPYKAEE